MHLTWLFDRSFWTFNLGEIIKIPAPPLPIQPPTHPHTTLPTTLSWMLFGFLTVPINDCTGVPRRSLGGLEIEHDEQ